MLKLPKSTVPVWISVLSQAALVILAGCQSAPTSPVQTPVAVVSALSVTPENADLGFRANPNGFKFANGSAKPYLANLPGSEYLTLKGMQAMFGDEHVCTGQTAGDNCVPTPEAKKWQAQMNLNMNNGQCEGLAVLALSMFEGYDQPSHLEAGKTSAYELDYGSSVRETVGRYFAYQFTDKVVNSVVKGTPTEVLAKLSAHLKRDHADPVTLGFFGENGGHATTPYAIEAQGNGIYHIKMYDNNWPDQERYLEVDTHANTWIYNYASRNPTEPAQAWRGDAQSMSLEFTPLSTRLQKAVCPFCNSGSESSEMRQIFLTAGTSGQTHIRVSDPQDPSQYIGWDASCGHYVNHLKGASFFVDKALTLTTGLPSMPIIEVPDHHAYTIQIDGQTLPSTEQVAVSIFGQGKAFELSQIQLDPHQQDRLDLGADDDSLSYTPGQSADIETPSLSLSYDEPNGSDYEIKIQNIHTQNGEALKADFDHGKLMLGDTGKRPEFFDLDIMRYLPNGQTQDFSKKQVMMPLQETDEIDYSAWGGQGQGMYMGQIGRLQLEPDVDGDQLKSQLNANWVNTQSSANLSLPMLGHLVLNKPAQVNLAPSLRF